MPLFIICSLGISFLVQTDSSYLSWMASPVILYVGFSFILFSAIAALSKRIPVSYAYDGFAVGALLVWFSYWYQLFKKDAPMFYFFPLYLALLTAGVTLLFLRRDDWVDQENLKGLRRFSKMPRFHPGIIASAVLISLEIHSHFLLFPVTMTLFIMRYTFTCYLAKHL